MQYDIDTNGEFAEIFKKIRELKNAKQTSYLDEYGAIIMMRSKGDIFVVAFGKGAKLQESFSSLKGDGKTVRHLYFKSVDEIDERLLRDMIEESFILGLEAFELKALRKRLV